MKKTITIYLILFISICSGCAIEPFVEPRINKNITYSADYDTVWKAIIQVFSEENYPIKAIEKDSGIISTDFINMGRMHSLKDKILHPDYLLAVWENVHYTINVFANEIEENKISVTINTHVEAFESNTSQQWHVCYSKGVIEKSILDSISSKIGYDKEIKVKGYTATIDSEGKPVTSPVYEDEK